MPPVTATGLQLFDRLVDQGHGDLDQSGLYCLYEAATPSDPETRTNG